MVDIQFAKRTLVLQMLLNSVNPALTAVLTVLSVESHFHKREFCMPFVCFLRLQGCMVTGTDSVLNFRDFHHFNPLFHATAEAS